MDKNTASIVTTLTAVALLAVLCFQCAAPPMIETFGDDNDEREGEDGDDNGVSPETTPSDNSTQMDNDKEDDDKQLLPKPSNTLVPQPDSSKLLPANTKINNNEITYNPPVPGPCELLPIGDDCDELFVLAQFLPTQSVPPLRNMSRDLRGDPLCIPRTFVSPFNNSTIDCNLTQPLTCYDDASLNRPSMYKCSQTSSIKVG
jgi:hypothetical protein